MKNSLQYVRILAVNVAGVALALLITFLIALAKADVLVYNETPFVFLLLPMLATVVALVLTVPFRVLRFVRAYYHLTFMLFLVFPAASLLLHYNHAVWGAFAQKDDLLHAQNGTSIGQKKAEWLGMEKQPGQFEAAIPDGAYLYDADHPAKDSNRLWIHFLKPSLLNGADDYVACYDSVTNQFSALRTPQQLWEEWWYAKQGERQQADIVSTGIEPQNGTIVYFEKNVGAYVATLASDAENKTVWIETVEHDPTRE